MQQFQEMLALQPQQLVFGHLTPCPAAHHGGHVAGHHGIVGGHFTGLDLRRDARFERCPTSGTRQVHNCRLGRRIAADHAPGHGLGVGQHAPAVHGDGAAVGQHAHVARLGGRLRHRGTDEQVEAPLDTGIQIPQRHFLGAAAGRQQADAQFHQPGVQFRVRLQRVAVQQHLAATAQRQPARRADHREQRVLEAHQGALQAIDEAVQERPVAAAGRVQHALQVRTGTKMRRIAADDQRLKILPDPVQRQLHGLDAVLVERVHLGVEFEQRHAVAHVPQAGRRVAQQRLAGTAQVGHRQRAGLARQRAVHAIEAEVLRAVGFLAIEPSVAAGERRSQQRRHRLAVGLDALHKPGQADLIQQLERPPAPRIALAHGGVDGEHVAGDFRRHGGRVGQGVAQQAARESSPCIVAREQIDRRTRPGAGEVHLLLRPIIECAQVQRLPLLVRSVQAIKTAAGLATDPAALQQGLEQRRQVEQRHGRIAGRQLALHVARDVSQHVQAHQVDQAEHAGARQADRLAGDGVGLLDRQAQLQRRAHPGQHGQHADTVADERRRVAGIDHFLAQLHGAELAQRFGRLWPGGRSGHQLQQAHVARRVEEMRDQKIGRKAWRQAGGDFGKADAGGVGTDDRARSAHALDPLEQRLLHRQALDHHLDDPVDLGQPPEILVEAAGADQVGRRAVHQRRRLALEQILLAALGRLARQVQQQHRQAGIGHLRGNAGAHVAGAQHRHLPDRRVQRHLRAPQVLLLLFRTATKPRTLMNVSHRWQAVGPSHQQRHADRQGDEVQQR